MSGDWELKPARDLELSFQERLRSIQREPSVFSAASRLAWWLAVGAVMRGFHRYQVVGRELLPRELPFVMIGNHSSHLDVVSMMLALPATLRGRVFPLAAADHFFGEIPMAAFTAFAINALPMWRQGGGKGRETMLQLRQRLVEDKCGLVLFPEGTRTRTGEMARFKSGIGMLVAGTTIPVVPCYIAGAYEAFPPTVKLPRPRPVTLHIGAPISFGASKDDKEGCEAVAAALEIAVRALRPA